ncbi:MAG: multiubiquitin domain-containing protein [Aequorivita sp.]
MEDKTHLKECYCRGVKPALAYEYIFDINEKEYSTKNQIVTGNELHAFAETSPETHFIRMVTGNGKILVGPAVQIDLTECGIERFIIRQYKQETIELENCFCEGVKPVITYQYIIKINGDKYTLDKEKISREEILKLVDKDPNKHRLRMFTKNGKIILLEGQVIDLTECGVERFVYEPLDCTEGYISNLSDKLPRGDADFLTCSDEKVDVIEEGNLNWLIFRNFRIPDGYNFKVADAAILIPPHYPSTQLDMIYFHPPLARADGKPIQTLSNQIIEGKAYQRWSRHRTALNRWNPEIDDIESHLDLMKSCLNAEFDKR